MSLTALQERNLENSMLRPTVHDSRYDEPDYDEIPDKKFFDDDYVTDGDNTYRILCCEWIEEEREWVYTCEQVLPDTVVLWERDIEEI